MLTVDRCRELLGAGCTLSDEELARLRDGFYALATVVVDVARERPCERNTHMPRIVVIGLEDVLGKLSEGERADVIERASIVEFDGGRPRDQAERLAVHGVLTHLVVANPYARGARTVEP
jgi:hypothetical protein